MLVSLDVENFRCFRSLKLSGLKRMNIVTGDNASGKTALLEAIFASTKGIAEGMLFLNQQRGMGGPILPGVPILVAPQHFSGLWDHYFYSSKRNGSSFVATQASI